MASSIFQLIRSDGKVFSIAQGPTTIGRQRNNQIIVSDRSASRLHASLLVKGNRCWIRDENSSGGVFINDQRVKGQSELQVRDIVRIGDTQFRLLVGSEALPRSRKLQQRQVFVVMGGDCSCHYNSSLGNERRWLVNYSPGSIGNHRANNG